MSNQMLIVSDLGGTILDPECKAPVWALQRAFKTSMNLDLSEEEIRKHLGLNKRTHIKNILSDHDKKSDSITVRDVFLVFYDELKAVLKERSFPLPGAVEFVEWCESQGFKFVITTGYTKEIASLHLRYAQVAGWKNIPITVVAGNEVPVGRPFPYMIYKAMGYYNIPSIKHVFKLGDTDNDMLAAKNAGMLDYQTFKVGSHKFNFELVKDKILFTKSNSENFQREVTTWR